MKETIQSKIEEYGIELSDLSDKIKEREREIKDLSEQYNEIRMKKLPEFLENNGVRIGSKINIGNGRTIELKAFFSASIPSDSLINKKKDPWEKEELIERRNKCFEWLNSNGLGDIIKRQIIASFQKEDEKRASRVLQDLQEKGISCRQEEKVHPLVLKGALKEIRSEGKEVPEDIFSISTGSIVELK